MRNDYYEIAINNLGYLQSALTTSYYNNIATDAQQVAEKMLKSVAERVCTNAEPLLKTHNLRSIYDAIHSIEPSFVLDRGKLSLLKDMYYDAKYPGDDFVTVSRDECNECLSIMYDVIAQVHSIRHKYALHCHEIEEKFLKDLNTMSVF